VNLREVPSHPPARAEVVALASENDLLLMQVAIRAEALLAEAAAGRWPARENMEALPRDQATAAVRSESSGCAAAKAWSCGSAVILMTCGGASTSLLRAPTALPTWRLGPIAGGSW